MIARYKSSCPILNFFNFFLKDQPLGVPDTTAIFQDQANVLYMLLLLHPGALIKISSQEVKLCLITIIGDWLSDPLCCRNPFNTCHLRYLHLPPRTEGSRRIFTLICIVCLTLYQGIDNLIIDYNASIILFDSRGVVMEMAYQKYSWK